MTNVTGGHQDLVQDSRLRREFTLWSSFAFAFAFLSPIVALYSVFGLALITAGPSFWWGFLIVAVGQLLIASVFGMLASRWPLEGSVYQWSRQLLGRGYGWFAGWTYMWTLVIAMPTLALAAAGFLANAAGLDAPSATEKSWIALAILLAGTAANMAGRRVLRILTTASIAAEVVGSLGLGAWLLIAHRHNSFSVLTQGAGAGGHGYLSLSGPFLLAIVFIGFSFVGFESAGDIAEEVKDPSRNIPKAMLSSLALVTLVVAFASLAIVLAVPDLGAVAQGKVADPVFDTLTFQLGSGIARPVEILFVIGFLASFLAVQTSASRVIWSTAREGELPAAAFLGLLTEKQRQPANALLVTTVLGSAVLLLSNVASDIYTLLVNLTAGSFFLAFMFPLVGALVVQLRGRWVPGEFSLSRIRWPISVVAVAWVVVEFINIAWPRDVYPHAYLNWSVWLGLGVLGVLGAFVFTFVRMSGAQQPEAALSDAAASAVLPSTSP